METNARQQEISELQTLDAIFRNNADFATAEDRGNIVARARQLLTNPRKINLPIGLTERRNMYVHATPSANETTRIASPPVAVMTPLGTSIVSSIVTDVNNEELYVNEMHDEDF